MEQTIQTQRRQAWLCALGMTAAFFALIFLRLNFRYAMNDDVTILRCLMGYENGRPAHYELFTHALLAWPLWVLHSLFPLVPWYTWAQLAALFLSLTVIAKSLMLCCLNHDKPMWAGAVLALVYFAAFGLEYTVQPTFSCTAAMPGAAAVAQLFSLDDRRASARELKTGMLGSALLLSLGSAFRFDALYPCLAYCALAVVVLFWERLISKRSVRSLLSASLVMCAVIIGMVGIRLAEKEFHPSPEYLAWNEERVEVMDYRKLSDIPQEVLDELGWDDTTLKLVGNWFFLDGSITTDAFSTINDTLDQLDERTPGMQLQDALHLLHGRISKSSYAFLLMGGAVLAGLAAAVYALFQPGRRLCRLFAVLCTFAGFGVMLLYLGFKGRVPMRAISAMAMPAMVMALCLLPFSLPRTRPARICLCVLAAVMAVYTLVQAAPLYRLYQRQPDALPPGQAHAALETYAVQHPDCLFIADNAIADDDLDPFPDYPDGLPMNISYWGGWDMRSPESEKLFARFGLDVWNFDPEAFLREDVLFAAVQEDPPEMLVEWLEKRTGKEISWETIAQSGEVSILHFTENEAAQ